MHYNDQLRLLDSLVDSGEKLPDNARVPFLESAIESVPDLQCVKITDNVLQAQLGSTRPISYRSYFDLLKDAAFHLDQATKKGSKIRRKNVHFSGPNNEDDHQSLLSDDHHTNQQLVDRGANGGLAGSDMCVIHKTHRKNNIQGIDNHEVTVLDVVTAATLLNTSQGKVIGIFNEYAYLGKGSSIHSSGQLEWFKTNVDEKSSKVGGTQLIPALDGYSVPLLIKDGLAYATSLGTPTDQDRGTYPHVFFTSPDEWDPSVLDHDRPHLDGLDPSQVPD